MLFRSILLTAWRIRSKIVFRNKFAPRVYFWLFFDRFFSSHTSWLVEIIRSEILNFLKRFAAWISFFFFLNLLYIRTSHEESFFDSPVRAQHRFQIVRTKIRNAFFQTIWGVIHPIQMVIGDAKWLVGCSKVVSDYIQGFSPILLELPTQQQFFCEAKLARPESSASNFASTIESCNAISFCSRPWGWSSK